MKLNLLVQHAEPNMLGFCLTTFHYLLVVKDVIKETLYAQPWCFGFDNLLYSKSVLGEGGGGSRWTAVTYQLPVTLV